MISPQSNSTLMSEKCKENPVSGQKNHGQRKQENKEISICYYERNEKMT
jgi:hypothetical protein